MFPSQVLVALELFWDALAELLPVQMSDKLFELVLIHGEVAPKSICIELYETVVSEALLQIEARALFVFHLQKALYQAVKHVEFLGLEESKFSFEFTVSLSQLLWL